MSLNAPDYNSNPMTKQAYEDGVREGRKQMLDEMLSNDNTIVQCSNFLSRMVEFNKVAEYETEHIRDLHNGKESL